MTQEKKIGFKQRVPALAFREAIREYFPDCKIEQDLVSELLAGYFTGDYARHRSVLHITASLNNPDLLDFFQSNRQEFSKAATHDREPLLIGFALLCARYSFCYDIAVELAKQFRLQDIVSKDLLAKSISNKYGFNENVKRTMERFLAFCVEATIVERPDKATYKCVEPYKPLFPITIELWKKVFVINEPLAVVEDNPDLPFEPFFRYLNLF